MSEQIAINKTNNKIGSTWVADVSAGLIIGFIVVIIALSLASLVFSGELASEFPRGVSIVLITAAAITFVMTMLSSIEGVIASIQDNPAVLTTVAISAIIPTLSSEADLLPTVIILIAVTSVLTGGCLWLLGRFDLGDLVRYIPYPVIGGFLAGTGWLLLRGAIGTMADYGLGFVTLPDLFQLEQLARWLPGLVFSLGLFFGLRTFKHLLTLPLLMLAGLVGIYAWIGIVRLMMPEIDTSIFLIGGSGQTGFVNPLPYGAITQADWGAILAQWGNISVIIIMTAITLLLNVSGTEVSLKMDVDLNTELKSAGIANMLSGAVGGMIGFHALSLIVLNHRVGARTKLSGIVVSLVCVGLMIAGSSIVGLIPTSMLGGILLFLGIDFLNDWVVQGWRKFSQLDFAVVLIILVTIALYGYLAGMGVGLALMVAIFVYKYSQIDIFHQMFSGADATSNIQRNAHHQKSLQTLGLHTTVIALKGYIFFGTANKLLNQIRDRIQDDTASLEFLILDFRRVSGLDSSAEFSFSKINDLAEMHKFVVIITHIDDVMWDGLLQSGLNPENTKRFDNLDYGLEWCEDELLNRNAVTAMHLPLTITVQLEDFGFSRAQTNDLKPYLERQQYQAGETIIQAGDDAGELFFIEQGQASVMLQDGIRIQTLNLGTVVGEIGFFLNQQRSASVIADIPTTAYRLSHETLDQMKQQHPELAIAFTELMLQIVANRLIYTNRELVALNR